ncbi:MATE family efflux transporter, partial [Lachnospiraceae bacterium OttesenSCG-928-E19]|nr:MATE family efflux transporter [Lachnospiraceae bacterium OttesenSCG-928-E19]
MWEKELRLKFGKYVSLNVIAMMGLSCYILADTFFVANGVGVQGLTALNLVIPIYSFINGVGLMLGIGGATKYAINRAQGNELGGNEVFSKAVRLGIAAGILFLVLGVFGAGKISTMLGADESIWELANVYVKTIMCFSPAFIMNNICVAFVRNDGEPNLAMQAMLSGSIANIILDYLFIYPLNLGMFGAAFATGFAPIISMIMVSKHLRNGHNNFHLVKSSKSYWKTIVSLGSASFITEASSGIVIIVFNIVILKLEGNLGVAAYGVVANLALVATALFTGIAQGVQPLVSEN